MAYGFEINIKDREAKAAKLEAIAQNDGEIDGIKVMEDVQFTDSYLIQLLPISNSQNGYKFKLAAENSTNPHPLDVLLERQDIFVATDIARFIVHEDDLKQGSGRMQSYYDGSLFTTADEESINAVLNGKGFYKTNIKEYINNYPFIFDENAPRTQPLGVAAPEVVKNSYGTLHGFKPFMSGSQIISGRNSNEFKLDVSTWAGFNAEAGVGFTNYVAVAMLGFLGKGAAL